MMKRNAHFLGFAAEIDDKLHPAALFKIADAKIHLWDCHHPSTGQFFFEMDARPWVAVKQPEILRAGAFNGAAGICLHAYICKGERVNDLIETWGKKCGRRWIVGDGPFRLVVLGEG